MWLWHQHSQGVETFRERAMAPEPVTGSLGSNSRRIRALLERFWLWGQQLQGLEALQERAAAPAEAVAWSGSD